MYNITSKLEVVVDPVVPIPELCTMALKGKVAALVCDDPNLITPLITHRFNVNGTYKVIQTVDFPSGKLFAFDKIRSIGAGAYGVDGFDIMLSARNEIECLNELKVITEFLKQINRLYEIRVVLGTFTRNEEYLRHMLKAIKTIPITMIRLDNHLILPETNTTKEKIEQHVKLIREYSGANLKLSPNINLEAVKSYGNMFHRYDITTNEFFKIMKDLEQDIDGVKVAVKLKNARDSRKKNTKTSMTIGSISKSTQESVQAQITSVPATVEAPSPPQPIIKEIKTGKLKQQIPVRTDIKIVNKHSIVKPKMTVYSFNPITKNMPVREIDTSKMRVLKGKKST